MKIIRERWIMKNIYYILKDIIYYNNLIKILYNSLGEYSNFNSRAFTSLFNTLPLSDTVI